MDRKYEIEFETLKAVETQCHPKKKITLKNFRRWKVGEYDETKSDYYRVTLEGVGSWYIDDLSEAERFLDMLEGYEFLPQGDPRSAEEDAIGEDYTDQYDHDVYVCLDADGKLICEIGEETLAEAMEEAEIYLKGPGRQKMYDLWIEGGRRMELWPPFSKRAPES